jgi:hypothetical protein
LRKDDLPCFSHAGASFVQFRSATTTFADICFNGAMPKASIQLLILHSSVNRTVQNASTEPRPEESKNVMSFARRGKSTPFVGTKAFIQDYRALVGFRRGRSDAANSILDLSENW